MIFLKPELHTGPAANSQILREVPSPTPPPARGEGLEIGLEEVGNTTGSGAMEGSPWPR